MNEHITTNEQILELVAFRLLQMSAEAWAAGAELASERLAAGAWALLDGQEFLDRSTA